MVTLRDRSIFPEGGTVLLSFSGGVDSLVLLDKLLSKGNIVHTVYIDGPQGSTKVAAENIYRNKALVHLREKYPELLGEDRYLNIDVIHSRSSDGFKQTISTGTSCLFGQPIDWVYGMVQATRCFEVDFTHVALGYLATDQFSVHAAEFATVFEAMHGFTSGKPNERPLVIFPLIHHRKETTIDYLKNENLIHLAWWCELPKTEGDDVENFKVFPCNTCPACRTHYFADLANRFKRTRISLIEEAIAARHEFLDREYDVNAPLQQELCFDEDKN
jgi:7-cyano-7-deazaguanine synthase in queuosine biosynthesis